MPPTSPAPSPPLASQIPSLEVATEDASPELGWLEASYRDPDTFWARLFEHAASAPVPPRSRAGVTCDLYTDAVARHAAGGRNALVWSDSRKGWRSLSYADLHARAGALAGAWLAQGAKPGATVALVLPLGTEYLVALAAALRLGLCVSALAPEGGERYLATRLEKLAPDHLVLDERLPPPVGRFAKLALQSAVNRPAPLTPAYVFGPKEPCARLFSPLRDPLDTPVELTAEIAYQNALRDGVLALPLAPGRCLAAPGFHREQHHPALLFTCLLAGATFVHIDIEDLRSDPALLAAQKIDILGVTPEIRDLLRANSGLIGSVTHWFKSVDEPMEWLHWRDFAMKNCAETVLSSNVLVDAAAGGCVLFSTRRPKKSIHSRVLPSAGRLWTLGDPTGAPTGPDPGNGVFFPGPAKDGWFLLARTGREYLWGSTLLPRRAGRVFPAKELCALVAGLPSVVGACVVPLPASAPSPRFLFILLVFTGAAPTDGVADRVKMARAASFGPDFVPDEVEVIRLFPRRKGNDVDTAWCHGQYLSGRLGRKAADPVFEKLTVLRGMLLPAGSEKA
ncbi:MAG: AMP-binding protein [Byssovorax sp.]